MALNGYLFGEMRFVGNEMHYEDPRNSFLNQVLERRTGIPITLALIYMEVARRAGLPVEGVTSRALLLRCPARRGLPDAEDLIIDAFHGGALLSPELLRQRAEAHNSWHDSGVDPALVDSRLLPHATKPQILARMLLNLKRVYVRMLSFPQARDITELLIAVDPAAINELRDRGLLAYYLKDFPAALRDLQAYLDLTSSATLDEGERQGARADLGARQDAPQTGRFAQLRFQATRRCPSGQSFNNGQIGQCGSASVHVAPPWWDRYRNARRNASTDGGSSRVSASCTDRDCLRNSVVTIAVAEPLADPGDARVGREHRVIGGKQQHAMRAGFPELGSGLIARRAAISGPRMMAGSFGERRNTSTPVRSACRRFLGVRAGDLYALLELFLRRAPHRVGGQRTDALEGGERGVPLPRRRVRRQHFPHEQCEGIPRRRGQAAVERLQRCQQLLESRQGRSSLVPIRLSRPAADRPERLVELTKRCDDADHHECDPGSQKACHVRGLDVKQHGPKRLAQRTGQQSSSNQARSDQRDNRTSQQGDHIARRGTDGHANRELFTPLGNELADHTVHADQREDQRERRE